MPRNTGLERPRIADAHPRMTLCQLSCGVAVALGALIAPHMAQAQALEEGAFPACDATAYLTQGHLSRTYAVDLESGDYKLAVGFHESQTLPQYAWTRKASLNALGFNPNDGFAYGWSQFHKQPVRVYNDWSVEPLDVDVNGQSYIDAGDVSIPENKLYLYSRNGSNAGLYAVDLDKDSETYLKMRLVVSSKKLKIDIFDLAVHPHTGLIYAVEANGTVVQVDPSTGDHEDLGNSQVYSTSGAAFFDGDGNLYVQRNYDGKIFRIGIDSGNYLGEHIATGPSSSSNDGFRCATAPFSQDSIQLSDFGDAPDSYGTSAGANGASHAVSGSEPLRLGGAVDTESDAYTFPLSESSNGDDEDGVKFVNSLVAGQNARALVDVSGKGYLNMWLDSNRDGEFDVSEQMVVDQEVGAGTNTAFLTVPSDLKPGETWARVRLSSTQGLQATGPAADGEVEDYLVNLMGDPVTVSTYPSKNGWSTIAFEDNWPFVGDYDMNDLVTRMRTRTYKSASGITQVDIEGYVTAVGAFYKNGFAVRLPGVPRDAVDESKLEFHVSNLDVTESPLEADRKEAIFVITDNVFNHVTPGSSCLFYRTEYQCGADLEFKFSLSIPFKEAQAVDLSGVFDPFLFATPGAYHGEHFASPPGRSYEVHLKNQAPTEAFDYGLFAEVGQDASNASAGKYFLTENGMPWALEVGTEWRYPYEYVELAAAYPDFPDFATSSGEKNQDWYLESNADTDLIVPE